MLTRVLSHRFLLVALTLAASSAAPAQVTDSSGQFNWKTVHIGAGGLVTGIAVSPNDASAVFVRTDVGNAYKLNGSTWTPLRVHTQDPQNTGVTTYNDTATPASYGVSSIAVDPSNSQNIYMAFPTLHSGDVSSIATSQGVNIYRSTDGGKNFSAGNLDVDGTNPQTPGEPNGPDRSVGERLQVDPQNSQVIYYGTGTSGLYLSTDGGATWNQAGGGAPTGDVIDVVFYAGGGTANPLSLPNPVTATIYATTFSGDVFQSTNGGASWANLSQGTGLSGSALTTTIDTNGTIYVAQNNSKNYWTYSNSTWSTVTVDSDDTVEAVVVDAHNTQRIFVIGTGDALSRSLDGGQSWTNFHKIQFAPSQFAWLPQTQGADQYTFRSTGGIKFDANGNLWVVQGNEGALEYTFSSAGDVETANNPPLFTIQSAGIEELVATQLVELPGSNDTVIGTAEDTTGFVITNPDTYSAKQVALQGEFISAGYGVAYCPDSPNYVAVSTSNEYNAISANAPNYSGYSNDSGSSWNRFGGTFKIGGNDAPAGSIAVSARGGQWGLNGDHIVVLPLYTPFLAPEYSKDGGATWSQTYSFPLNSDGNTLALPFRTLGNAAVHQRQLLADPITPDLFYLKFLSANGSVDFYVSKNGGQDWTGQDAGLPQGTFHGQLETNRAVSGDLWFADGWEGATAHGVWHRSPNPDNPDVYSFVKVPGIDNAIQIALGKQTDGGDANYTVYVYGKATNDPNWGVFRSTNGGGSWDRISYYPTGIYDRPTAMAASWDNAGKVYLGFVGSSFVYSQPSGTGSNPSNPSSQDKITASTFPASVSSTGSATVSVSYTTTTSRTLHAILWDSSYNFKGEIFQTVNGSGTVNLTVPDNSSITTSVAYMRVELTDGTNTLDTAADYNIPVGSTAASDTITSVSWPASVSATGPATVSVTYSAGSGRSLIVYLWDSSYNYKGQTSQAVSGNGTASITVSDNSSITSSVAYMRVQLLDSSSNVLDTANNTSIPVQ